MSRASSPFSGRVVLAILAIGALAFLLFLYAIGAGWNGQRDSNGGSHAAANGLNGYSGFARLMKSQGYEVSLSRSKLRMTEEALLVITPDVFGMDTDELKTILDQRRYVGPTLIILPKWIVGPIQQSAQAKARQGWVNLGGAIPPNFMNELEGLTEDKFELEKREHWYGLGMQGDFPVPSSTIGLRGDGMVPLVSDANGDSLAGYLYDNGYYPVLADAAGVPPLDTESPNTDDSLWPVVVVVEPDLLNNYGLSDRTRAELAMRIVEVTMEDYDLPIIFDLTIPGLGRSENLLTMAFRPPFLAATLCLVLAALVIAWRSLGRFGPPIAEAPTLAMGKRQLARNSAALIERARRLHLLGAPYAALISNRLAAALGIRENDVEAREAAIAHVQSMRGMPADFHERANALRTARRPSELVRAASSLRSIERTLAQ